MKDLSEYRGRIDELDREILRCWKERMDLASSIAAYKKEVGMPVFDPARERALLAKIEGLAGEEYAPYAKTLYTVVMELSKALQESRLNPASGYRETLAKTLDETPNLFPLSAKVACQGTEGAYSMQAAEKLFPLPDICCVPSFEGVFEAIERGDCRYGVLPLENSTAGSVAEVYRLMQGHDFRVVRSVRLRIEHSLLQNKDSNRESIREIISHEQALRQCREYLKREFPSVKQTAVANTAVAAKMVRDSGRTDLAALSSRSCAALYGLKITENSVQDQDHNYTRFLCISKTPEIYPGADRTMLTAVIPHRPGSLYRVLSRFYALGVNLTKLESIPIPGRDFEFRFCFELQIPVYSETLPQLLDILEHSTEEFRYLGSYSELV